jgi:N-hydroxyarylamine O-acetyltransferase
VSDDDFASLDLDAYFRRIGYDGESTPTVAVFDSLHRAHATCFTFENLDILLDRPIRIDLPSIQRKMIRDRRGGYCFEQNRLFAAALVRLGFRVEYLAGRVRFQAQRVLPRTHVLLLVEIDSAYWIADVGFGTVGLLQPLPLVANSIVRQGAWSYRLVNESSLWQLQSMRSEAWQTLYEFSLERQFLPDLEVSNYYVSTHPNSRFTQALIVQRSTPDARWLLRDFELTVDRGGDDVVTTVCDEADLPTILAKSFQLYFPAGTRFIRPSKLT